MLTLKKCANFASRRLPKPSLAYFARLLGFFVIALIGGIYLIFAPMVNYHFFNEKVLFRPIKCDCLHESVLGTRGKEVFFGNRDGAQLNGVYFPNSTGEGKTVLLHHGMAGNLNTHNIGYEQLANKLGVSLFVYDYSGFGKSSGSPSVRGLPNDARAAYDYLVNQVHTNPKSIIHYGASLGSGPAVALAAERPCAGMMLFAPYTSIKAAARDALPYLKLYPDFLIVDKDMESLAAINRIHCPILIVHGENDTTIRIHHGDELFAAANEPKQYTRVKRGDHFGYGLHTDDTLETFIRSL